MSEIQGKVKMIGDTQTFGSNGFQKREMVVTTDEQYPQDILIEFVQDKTGLLDKYRLGDTIKVDINLRGREWTSPQGEIKYFNTIQGWRITTLDEGSQEESVTASSLEEQDDDFPF